MIAEEPKTKNVYENEDLLTGCQAVSQGVRLADVDVIAAYPIRPYTEVMDALSKIIADGQLDAEYIIADSEHSQFEIVKHASSVNARAFHTKPVNRCDQSLAGAPAMIPSKSSGYRCASINASRPPSEQPLK